MIALNISYSLDLENQRVAYTLNKKDWYDNMGYKITLPERSVEDEFDIKKYNVQHWHKERLVDLICMKYFSDIRKPQSIKTDVSIVDKNFNDKFPDLESIIQSLT